MLPWFIMLTEIKFATPLTPAESFLRSYQSLCHSKIFQHFTDPEGSLPCSQEPSTGLYWSIPLRAMSTTHPLNSGPMNDVVYSIGVLARAVSYPLPLTPRIALPISDDLTAEFFRLKLDK
jgi:hypothetical protein